MKYHDSLKLNTQYTQSNEITILPTTQLKRVENVDNIMRYFNICLIIKRFCKYVPRIKIVSYHSNVKKTAQICN